MTRFELADFHPETGHLHECSANTHPGTCTRECAAHLFCVAQDAEGCFVGERDALIALMIDVYYGGASAPSAHNLDLFGELADGLLGAGYRRTTCARGEQ